MLTKRVEDMLKKMDGQSVTPSVESIPAATEGT